MRVIQESILKKLAILILSISFVGLCFTGCKSDDDVSAFSVPPRDRTEQQIEDKDTLQWYLEHHYYNAADFSTPGNYSYQDIDIRALFFDEETGEYETLPNPEENVLLIDAVDTYQIVINEIDYEFYVLNLNEGGGEVTNFTDTVLVNYFGETLGGLNFDSSANPISFDLISVIEGWRRVLPLFKTSTNVVENEDGTTTYSDYGFGVMFLPSGLSYYEAPPVLSGIQPYENLIFKFELYRAQPNDHDSDLVYTHLEDLEDENGERDFDIFNDDTDLDDLPNFFDPDDDGDGTLTRYEDLDDDGDPTNDDTDGDGVPNYLDPDDSESNQEED